MYNSSSIKSCQYITHKLNIIIFTNNAEIIINNKLQKLHLFLPKWWFSLLHICIKNYLLYLSYATNTGIKIAIMN